MKTLIIYSSETGNTKMVCEKAFEYINGEEVIIPIKEKDSVNLDEFDNIIVGTWIDKANANAEARKFINTLDFLDIAAPGVMIAQSIGRWGNFINQEAYGAAVKSLDYLPGFIRNQMYIDGAYRQPTVLDESTWNLLGFILILFLRRKPNFLKQGDITAFYLIWYGCGRMIIEGMRTDSLMFLGIRVSQWLSLFLILLGIGIIIYQRKKNAPFYRTEID